MEKMSNMPTPKSFGVFFGSVFCAYGLWCLFRGQHLSIGALPAQAWGAGAVGVTFLLTAWLRPTLLQIPNRLWYHFGLLLQRISAPIFMGLLFFLIFSPLAVLLRLFGTRFLDLKIKDKKETYWIQRNPEELTFQSLKNQF